MASELEQQELKVLATIEEENQEEVLTNKATKVDGEEVAKAEETNEEEQVKDTQESVIKTDEEIQKEIDELQKQLEIKTKELEKQKKQQARLARKQLKKHFSLRWMSLYEASKNWSMNDINLFCKYEPTVTNTLESIKKKDIQMKNKEAYDAIIGRKEPLVDVHLNSTQEEYKKILAEEERISKIRAYTTVEIDKKAKRLFDIRKRKQMTEYLLADLFEVKEVFAPKKKRGRPKKSEQVQKALNLPISH